MLISVKVLAVSQDKDSERTSSTSRKSFFVKVDRESWRTPDHEGPHMP